MTNFVGQVPRKVVVERPGHFRALVERLAERFGELHLLRVIPKYGEPKLLVCLRVDQPLAFVGRLETGVALRMEKHRERREARGCPAVVGGSGSAGRIQPRGRYPL